jgi:AbiV family abortive infection protein
MTLSLTKVDDLIDALHANAADLIGESSALLERGSFARAYALAHMAREELAKSIMLQAAGFKVLTGATVDWRDLMRRFRNHEDKLRLEGVINATLMSALGQPDMGVEALKLAAGAAKYRSQRKNTALYVELAEGNVSIPSEEFTQHQARRTWKLADLALQQQAAMRKKLGRFDAMDKSMFANVKVTSVEKLLQLEPAELLKRLGAAQAAIWAKDQEGQHEG